LADLQKQKLLKPMKDFRGSVSIKNWLKYKSNSNCNQRPLINLAFSGENNIKNLIVKKMSFKCQN